MLPISYASLLASRRIPGRSPPAVSIDFSQLDITTLKARRDAIVTRVGGRNPPITRVLSVPRSIPLGTGRAVVSELRLRHLAELQAFLEEDEVHPLEGLPPAWADPEPETRLARLATAWALAASWPPRLGTDRAAEILAGAGGRAFFLHLMVSEHAPSFSLTGALALLGEVTPTQWAGLVRVAYALTPRMELVAELAPDDSPSRASDWCLQAYRAMREPGGPTYRELGEWTLSQWRNFCLEGKSGEASAEFAARCKRVTNLLADVPHGD